MQTILIVEDEPGIADTLVYVLEQEGFATRWVQLAADAVTQLEQTEIAAVLLDIGLPDSSGLELCKQIRARWQVPVLFLTARKDEVDRIVGLEIGADDYIIKPFSPREVAARIKAVLRRTKASNTVTASKPAEQSQDQQQHCGEFIIDRQRSLISYHEQPLELTRYEYRLLQALLLQPERVLSRSQLLDKVWDNQVGSLERSIDTHIRSLRSKLDAIDPDYQPIKTRRGFGYYYSPAT